MASVHFSKMLVTSCKVTWYLNSAYHGQTENHSFAYTLIVLSLLLASLSYIKEMLWHETSVYCSCIVVCALANTMCIALMYCQTINFGMSHYPYPMPEEREGKIHQTKRMNPRLAFPGTMG
jgi:protein-S-isoprenylcysteine O-methyltransferase Ste14